MKAIVAVHGYDGAHGNAKPQKPVIQDRLKKGQDVAEFLSSLGIEVVVFVSGPESFKEDCHQIVPEVCGALTENYPVEFFHTGDTQGDVEYFVENSEEYGVSLPIFAVSSRDHAPRVLREWARYTDEADKDNEVFMVASDGMYTADNVEPFIVEGAGFKPFVGAFNEVWSVEPSKREEAAEKVSEVLDGYQ